MCRRSAFHAEDNSKVTCPAGVYNFDEFGTLMKLQSTFSPCNVHIYFRTWALNLQMMQHFPLNPQWI